MSVPSLAAGAGLGQDISGSSLCSHCHSLGLWQFISRPHSGFLSPWLPNGGCRSYQPSSPWPQRRPGGIGWCPHSTDGGWGHAPHGVQQRAEPELPKRACLKPSVTATLQLLFATPKVKYRSSPFLWRKLLRSLDLSLMVIQVHGSIHSGNTPEFLSDSHFLVRTPGFSAWSIQSSPTSSPSLFPHCC